MWSKQGRESVTVAACAAASLSHTHSSLMASHLGKHSHTTLSELWINIFSLSSSRGVPTLSGDCALKKGQHHLVLLFNCLVMIWLMQSKMAIMQSRKHIAVYFLMCLWLVDESLVWGWTSTCELEFQGEWAMVLFSERPAECRIPPWATGL